MKPHDKNGAEIKVGDKVKWLPRGDYFIVEFIKEETTAAFKYTHCFTNLGWRWGLEAKGGQPKDFEIIVHANQNTSKTTIGGYCSKCNIFNEYQSGSFVCFSCRR